MVFRAMCFRFLLFVVGSNWMEGAKSRLNNRSGAVAGWDWLGTL